MDNRSVTKLIIHFDEIKKKDEKEDNSEFWIPLDELGSSDVNFTITIPVEQYFIIPDALKLISKEIILDHTIKNEDKFQFVRIEKFQNIFRGLWSLKDGNYWFQYVRVESLDFQTMTLEIRNKDHNYEDSKLGDAFKIVNKYNVKEKIQQAIDLLNAILLKELAEKTNEE